MAVSKKYICLIPREKRAQTDGGWARTHIQWARKNNIIISWQRKLTKIIIQNRNDRRRRTSSRNQFAATHWSGCPDKPLKIPKPCSCSSPPCRRLRSYVCTMYVYIIMYVCMWVCVCLSVCCVLCVPLTRSGPPRQFTAAAASPLRHRRPLLRHHTDHHIIYYRRHAHGSPAPGNFRWALRHCSSRRSTPLALDRASPQGRPG